MDATAVEASQNEAKSPKQNSKTSHGASVDNQNRTDASKFESTANGEPAKPLAPPPRPGQQQNGNTPDYFTSQHGSSLSLEPNPFDQSFGGAPPETPGGTKLPSVAALTSPSSLLPGSGSSTFNWGGGSLRTGPLSPAMLSGPANDYFGDTHLRGGFPTPNESSLRTGLTPGGSGSMFPAPSPNSQALYNQIQSTGATPSTIDFHRTAMNAAAAKREQQSHQSGNQQHHPGRTSMPPVTSQPQEVTSVTSAPAPTLKPEPKAAAGQYDPHDNDAANGLFLLAQGGGGAAQAQAQFSVPPQPAQASPVPVPVPGASVQGGPAQATTLPVQGQVPAASPSGYNGQQTNGTARANGISANGGIGSGRGLSESHSPASDESEATRPSPRGRGKRNSEAPTTNGRRKAQESTSKAGPANKKAKTNGNMPMPETEDDSASEDEDSRLNNGDGPKHKMSEEEKRKNFLERNRVAALKCRQRKKQWLQNLQSKVEMYSSENESLTAQITQLREEVVNLKTLLLAHKDCPVTQQQGLHGGSYLQQGMEPYNNPQINPYGMAAPLPNQQVIAGQVGQRRFS